MDSVQELQAQTGAEPTQATGTRVQSGSYLLELSADWIVLRASENIHHLLGESHVTLIDEPIGRFVKSQALHDLRNLFSRLSGTTGIGRAYAVRLTEEPELVDVAFQLRAGRVLLEAVPSTGAFGECFGTVGGLIAGLSNLGGQALDDAGARRMRALTGFDRVTLRYGGRCAESSRGAFDSPGQDIADLPMLVVDRDAVPVGIFPRKADDAAAASALMTACAGTAIEKLRDQGVRASLRIPFSHGEIQGEFRCDSRTARQPSFELHAAAELFAQSFAMQAEIAALRQR